VSMTPAATRPKPVTSSGSGIVAGAFRPVNPSRQIDWDLYRLSPRSVNLTPASDSRSRNLTAVRGLALAGDRPVRLPALRGAGGRIVWRPSLRVKGFVAPISKRRRPAP